MVKNPPAMQETQVQSLGWGEPLEKGVAARSSVPAWRVSPRAREGSDATEQLSLSLPVAWRLPFCSLLSDICQTHFALYVR